MKRIRRIALVRTGLVGFIIRLPGTFIEAANLKIGQPLWERTTGGVDGHALVIDTKDNGGTVYKIQRNFSLSVNAEWCKLHGLNPKDKVRASIDDADRMWLEA